MKRLPVAEEDRRSIAEWFVRWAQLGRRRSISSAVREMFAEDAIAFGSKVEMMTSQARSNASSGAPSGRSIEDYRYDLSTLEIVISPDRLMAMGAVIFRSTGLHADGKTGSTATAAPPHADARPRSARRGSARTRHVSLKPGTPTPSHGNRARSA